MKAIVILVSLALGALVACSPALTSKDKAEIAEHAEGLAGCHLVGNLAKLDGGAEAGWSAYYACTVEAGLR